jgi:hypothetical protein
MSYLFSICRTIVWVERWTLAWQYLDPTLQLLFKFTTTTPA